MVLARKPTVGLFVLLAAMVYAAVFCVARAHATAGHAGAIGWGVLFDLSVTVPVVYYLLLVRPGHSSWMPLVAVALAGARAAGFLLSPAEQANLPPLRWLAVPLETWVLVTAARGRRYGWATRLAATELAVLYYGLCAWRARPLTPAGSRAFGVAQASGYANFSVLIMMAVVMEGLPLHLLLRNWSPAAAWIFTGFGIYSFLWMLALYRSLALRPVLIGAETVVLQVGFLWRVEVRRDQIREVRRFSAAETGYVSLVVMNKPQWVIELTEPAALSGPLGRRKPVTRIGLAVDDREAFGAALEARP